LERTSVWKEANGVGARWNGENGGKRTSARSRMRRRSSFGVAPVAASLPPSSPSGASVSVGIVSFSCSARRLSSPALDWASCAGDGRGT
jgi:hypothetical protein